MKYTKENLAAAICEKIEFDGEYTCWIDHDVDFDNCVVAVKGEARGYTNRFDEFVFDSCELETIEIYFEDSDTSFNTDELTEMEKLVKLWM